MLTEAEKLAEWADPEIWSLLMDLRVSIMNRYKHLPKVRKISPPSGSSAGVRCVESKEASAPKHPKASRQTTGRGQRFKLEELAA